MSSIMQHLAGRNRSQASPTLVETQKPGRKPPRTA